MVIFGVKRYSERDLLDLHFQDHAGISHRLRIAGLPGGQLDYQGALSDRAKSTELQPLWDILGWQIIDGRLQFVDGRPKIALDIDLDCFVVDWGDYLFPWPDEVFETEFLTESGYWSTKRQTGLGFFRGLIAKAGYVTVAREPDFCGGEAKTDEVFRKVNLHLFDGNIVLNE